MTKIKITALTDKASDEEILAKLKKIGVKIKDKSTEETGHEEAKEQLSPAGETLVEKRVASTIIRRRVQAPPVKEKEEPKEEKKEIPEETKEGKTEKKTTPKKKAEEKEKTVKGKEEEEPRAAGKKAKTEPQIVAKNKHKTRENKRSRKSPKRKKRP